MSRTIDDTFRLIDAGAGVTVDVYNNPTDVERVLSHARKRGVMVVLKNTDKITISDLLRFVSKAQGHVIID